jgi:hypothetical protein
VTTTTDGHDLSRALRDASPGRHRSSALIRTACALVHTEEVSQRGPCRADCTEGLSLGLVHDCPLSAGCVRQIAITCEFTSPVQSWTQFRTATDQKVGSSSLSGRASFISPLTSGEALSKDRIRQCSVGLCPSDCPLAVPTLARVTRRKQPPKDLTGIRQRQLPAIDRRLHPSSARRHTDQPPVSPWPAPVRATLCGPAADAATAGPTITGGGSEDRQRGVGTG